MLRSRQKIILAMCFCLLDGMIIGSACTSLDYGDKHFSKIMLIGGFIVSILVICYIITVFKSVWIESKFEHDMKEIINMSHFD